MSYIIKHTIAKYLILFGMLLCIGNYGYRLHSNFVDDFMTSFVDFEDTERKKKSEKETQDRTDKGEDETEKEKITSPYATICFDELLKKHALFYDVVPFLADVNLDPYTPPPEFS